jgi:FAD/FMN-containing dehydrogenase
MSNDTSKITKCRDCGTTDVEWRKSKAGKWYLAQLRYGARGSVYSDGPHYLACSAKGPRAERLRAIEAHNAEVEAKAAEFNARILEMIKSGMTADEITKAVYGENNE